MTMNAALVTDQPCLDTAVTQITNKRTLVRLKTLGLGSVEMKSGAVRSHNVNAKWARERSKSGKLTLGILGKNKHTKKHLTTTLPRSLLVRHICQRKQGDHNC